MNRIDAMRVAALYDIHGNLPALEAVLADVAGARVDAVVVGGDVVPGPMPRECLTRLQGLDVPVHCIAGNGEHDVLTARAGRALTRVPPAFHDLIRWSSHALEEEQCRKIASWPDTVRLRVDGLGEVLFCHATPRDDNEIFTRLTPEALLAPIVAAGAPLVVCGHTHMAFDRRIGGVRVVNAGSVGMPFGEPGAYWALIGPGVDLRHVDYDRGAAAAAIRETSYPGAGDFADRHVLHPPSEAEMLAAFGRAELLPRRGGT